MRLDPALFERAASGRPSSEPKANHTPVVRERPAEDGEVPRGGRQLAAVADEAGWKHVELYSCGRWGNAEEPSDFVSVRVSDPASRRRAFVLYRDGKAFDTWAYERGWKRSKVNDVKKMMRGAA